MRRTVTLPDSARTADDSAQEAHFRALESLYSSAPVNALFESGLEIIEAGRARITFQAQKRYFHAAGATHGTLYFKMLDDAAFYAANSLVSDRFLLTTGFNLHFTKPLREGRVIAEGKWISGKRRIFIAEAHLTDEDGDEIGRGTGTFMRSHIALSGIDGYRLRG